MSSYYRLVKGAARAAVDAIPTEFKEALRNKLNASLKPAIRTELKAELRAELKAELTAELKAELKAELIRIVTTAIAFRNDLPARIEDFCQRVRASLGQQTSAASLATLEIDLRQLVRVGAGLPLNLPTPLEAADLLQEVSYLHANAELLRPMFEAMRARRVLFCGQAYYNAWYLSRALRKLGWKADVYNWDENPLAQIYYHGQDFQLGIDIPATLENCLAFYVSSLYAYDIFHFSNAHGISFGWQLETALREQLGTGAEIQLIKALGKIIMYSQNGCHDGVSQTAFSQWGPESVCSTCRWQHEPTVCSDERNLAWGKFRNSVADFQCCMGINLLDHNDDPRVHAVPEFYCLDPDFWHPQIEIPQQYRLPRVAADVVRLYHAVGHRAERTRSDGVNIKSSHVYLPLIERLRAEGMVLELIEPTGIPNKEVRFLQAQADIFLDMLTYGWFGANIREAMMLAKPVICFIRPEWLASLREEIPAYADELPIISATPQTVELVLRDLIAHPDKRREIGLRGRQFAMKWHSDTAAGRRFDQIYSKLLAGNPLLRLKA